MKWQVCPRFPTILNTLLTRIEGVINSTSLPNNGITVDATRFTQENTLSLFQPGFHFCAQGKIGNGLQAQWVRKETGQERN